MSATISRQIRDLEKAIQETEQSTDPRFLARPAARAEQIEMLKESIDHLRQSEARAAADQALREERQRRDEAWLAMAPDRERLVERWNGLRQELGAVLAEAKRLDQLSRADCARPTTSEPLGPVTLIGAVLELGPDGRVLMRPRSTF